MFVEITAPRGSRCARARPTLRDMSFSTCLDPWQDSRQRGGLPLDPTLAEARRGITPAIRGHKLHAGDARCVLWRAARRHVPCTDPLFARGSLARMEEHMNWDRIAGNWKQFKGK